MVIHPFDYDLHFSSLPGLNSRVMVCFHGYGDNYEIALSITELQCVNATLVSFNFPEYSIKQGRAYDYRNATFGTIHELLPALYVLKHVVINLGIASIDLYGFSAGGGALVNAVGVLNNSLYDESLEKIGIQKAEKEKLLSAIQGGIIILDTPLKSIEEIINFRGSSEELEVLAKNYSTNNFVPINSLEQLSGLSLDIILHFQAKDEVLSNRDDALYIERLKTFQSKVAVIIGDDGGHMTTHWSLWKFYSQRIAYEEALQPNSSLKPNLRPKSRIEQPTLGKWKAKQ